MRVVGVVREAGLARDEGIAFAGLQRATGLGQTVRVVLGTDFHAVGKPLPAGTKVEVQISQPAGAEPTQLPEDLTITNAADTTCE